MTPTTSGTGLPRVSMSGMLILGVFLAILQNLFRSSIYASLMLPDHQPGSTTSAITNSTGNTQNLSLCLLHATTCAASFLNVLSHTAVALGVLNDTYVLSILVGVGFDVITRVLQLVWWIWATRTQYETTIPIRRWPTTVISPMMEVEDPSADGTTNNNVNSRTKLFLFVLIFVYVYHMIVHLRALCMNRSLSRLQSVLTSALNNLKGIPGDRYLDHVFAYTDLGSHIFVFTLSALILKKEGALFMVVGLLAVLAGLFYGVILFQVSFPGLRSESTNSDAADKNTNQQLASMIEVLNRTGREKNSTKTIRCSCKACKKKERRVKRGNEHHHPVSFTCNTKDGICQLWLTSFGQLSGVLSLATKP